MVCPIKDSNWVQIDKIHGKAAANAVSLFFGTDSFQKWYGSKAIPIIVEGEYIYNNKGDVMTVSKIVTAYKSTSNQPVASSRSAVLFEEDQSEAKKIENKIEKLREEEQKEYAAIDPNDRVTRKRIYDVYDRLITPLLKELKEILRRRPVGTSVPPTQVDTNLNNKVIDQRIHGKTFKEVLSFLKDKSLEFGFNDVTTKFINRLAASDSTLLNSRIRVYNGKMESPAHYNSETGEIVIIADVLQSRDDAFLARVLAHELVHAVTMSPFNKMYNFNQKTGGRLTETELIERAFREGVITELESDFLSAASKVWIAANKANKAKDAIDFYGLKEPAELLAEMFTNPAFYRFLRDNEETIFRKIINLFLSFFKIKDPVNLDEFMTLAYQQVDRSLNEGVTFTVDEKLSFYLDDISNKFSDLVLSVDEKSYLDGARNSYARLTRMVKEVFSPNTMDFGEAFFEKKAEDIYRSLAVPKDQTITIKNFMGIEETYTFQQLVDKQKKDQNTAIAYGNIAHLLIERAIRIATNLPIDHLNAKIDALRQEKPDQNAIDVSKMQWMGNINVLGPLFSRLGLNFTAQNLPSETLRDKMKSEVSLASKFLGVATKADMLIEHSDGAISIFDWKTGNGFFKDELTSIIMNYSSGYFEANDSRINKSKLEIILRAMMIKESFPETRFREMAVVHLDKQGADRIMEADFSVFLPMVEAYVKDQKPDVYAEMKAKGLFSPAAYKSASRATIELDAQTANAKDPLEQAKYAEQMLMSLTASKDIDVLSMNSNAREEMVGLATAVLEKTTGERLSVSADTEDMGWKRWIGNIYSSGNPIVQAFISYFDKAKRRAQQEVDEVLKKEESLLKKVLDEYYANNPGAKLTNKVMAGIKWHNKEGTGLFDFMWEFVQSIEEPGWYMRIITEQDVTAGRFTQAQYEYNKYQRETLSQYYDEVMGAPVLGTRTRADLENKPIKIPPNFAPRTFITRDDIIERDGFMSKRMLEYQGKKYASNFLENELYGKKDNVALPLKYIGNASVIGSVNHTFNSQASYRMFMTNLIMKKHLDPAYSVGQGVKGLLDMQGQKAHGDPLYYKNTRAFVDDLIKAQIQNIGRDNKITRKDIKFAGKTVNVSKSLDLLRSWVSSSTMWLKPISGAFNTLLIMTLNVKAAVTGDLLNNPYKDFGFKDLAFGMNEWRKSTVKKDSKLMKIAEQLRYLPNNYDYAAHSSKMLSSKHTMVSKDKLFLFHSIGEDMGQLSLMAAMLKHQINPKTGKSMWDSYSDEGVWEGGVRGVAASGEIISGLTSEEIMHLKRVSQKIHGGYRDSERTALEMGALGRWALQFKKYLPAVFESVWTNQYEDRSQGMWVERKPFEEGALFDANGNPVFKEVTLEDGTVVKETIYDWHARLQEGRLNTVLGIIATALKIKNDPKYKWENLDAAQKKNLMDLTSTAAMMILVFLGLSAGFDDDDEDSKIYRKFSRYWEDLSQGMHPMDLIRSVQSPFVALTKTKQTLESVGLFFVDGVLRGKTTQDGDMPGEAGLWKAFPIGSAYYDLNSYADDYDELSLH